MNELVKIVKDVPLVSTLDMWEGLGVEHAALILMIRRNESDFQEIRAFDFESRKTAGRPTAFCHLDEEQATYLVSLMKKDHSFLSHKWPAASLGRLQGLP